MVNGDEERIERIRALTAQIERLRNEAARLLNLAEERRAARLIELERKTKSNLVIAARYTPGGIDLRKGVPEIFRSRQALGVPRVREIDAAWRRGVNKIDADFRIEEGDIKRAHEDAITKIQNKIRTIAST